MDAAAPADATASTTPDAALAEGCSDGVKNGDETGVDCGGTCAPAKRCADGAACRSGNDCASSACNGTCQAPSCADGVKNGTETGFDCGGSCAPVKKCGTGVACTVNGDCVSDACAGGLCAASSAQCGDGVQNGTETGIDCGGSCAPLKRCAAGASCGAPSDCNSGVCTLGKCADCTAASCIATDTCVAKVCIPAPTSCGALHASHPAATDGVYRIDADGAGAGAPFSVYCDMTTAGGGFTALPLRFADAAFWTVSQSGAACVTVGSKTNDGVFEQTFSSNDPGFATTTLRFVPPVAVSEVRFVDFNHSPGGSGNSMDFTVGGAVPPANSSEAWHFTNAAGASVGLMFAAASNCSAPYVSSGGYCSRDTNLGGALFSYQNTVTFSSAATVFQMLVVQGCASGLTNLASEGERLYVNVPPGGDGVWRKGIFVR